MGTLQEMLPCLLLALYNASANGVDGYQHFTYSPCSWMVSKRLDCGVVMVADVYLFIKSCG